MKKDKQIDLSEFAFTSSGQMTLKKFRKEWFFIAERHTDTTSDDLNEINELMRKYPKIYQRFIKSLIGK